MRKNGEKNEQGFKKLRNRAEKSLRKCFADLAESPVEDVQKLIQELRVRQIELEMQNEELRKAQVELAKSRDRYFDLYDFAPIGYFTLDEKGLILEVNLTGADLLGSERASLMRKGFSQFVAPGSQQLFYSHCKRALETRSKQICEIELRRKGERSFWAQIQSVATKGDEGNFSRLRTAAIDITQQKHAEEALSEAHRELERKVVELTAELTATNAQLQKEIEEAKQAGKSRRKGEERYRTLVETMNEGFGVADERGVWTYVNEQFCKMLGYSRDEITGRPVHEWLDEVNRRIFNEQMIRRRKGGQERYEIAGIRKDGSTVHTLVSPKPILSADGQFQGSFAVITDITERRKAEESLRNALSEIKSLKERLEAENIYFRQESKMRRGFSHIIGESNALKYVLYRVEQVAPTNTTVLILGETGTGKELVAAAIHRMSPRKERPLVTVNCAALPPTLIESELFGREKGAFTGADSRQAGRFEIANGSTLCLDEIGEVPLEVQAKLLRVIQYNEFERLGASHTIRVDVRIIATTNRDLEEAVRKGRFRQDLYYRLNVFPLTVPTLRQRKDDIPLLAKAFVERYARELGKEFTSIQEETVKVLQDYDWPGNVRELENVIERAAILCPGPIFQLADKLEKSALSLSAGLRTMEETERDQILKTLSETRWRINGKKGAAAILDLHPSTLRARMHKLGIRRPEIKTQD